MQRSGPVLHIILHLTPFAPPPHLGNPVSRPAPCFDLSTTCSVHRHPMDMRLQLIRLSPHIKNDGAGCHCLGPKKARNLGHTSKHNSATRKEHTISVICFNPFNTGRILWGTWLPHPRNINSEGIQFWRNQLLHQMTCLLLLTARAHPRVAHRRHATAPQIHWPCSADHAPTACHTPARVPSSVRCCERNRLDVVLGCRCWMFFSGFCFVFCCRVVVNNALLRILLVGAKLCDRIFGPVVLRVIFAWRE